MHEKKTEYYLDSLIEKFPHFKVIDKESSWTCAAKNIRNLLKEKFKDMKIHVKAESYSGGSSIHIEAIEYESFSKKQMQDKKEEIILLCKNFKYGSFNGMNDSYEMKKERAFNEIFGGVSYIFVRVREAKPEENLKWIEKQKKFLDKNLNKSQSPKKSIRL